MCFVFVSWPVSLRLYHLHLIPPIRVRVRVRVRIRVRVRVNSRQIPHRLLRDLQLFGHSVRGKSQTRHADFANLRRARFIFERQK